MHTRGDFLGREGSFGVLLSQSVAGQSSLTGLFINPYTPSD